MNSSGIKRGLAASAVSALAIAGVPLLATSASAAPGETLTVVSVGPTLNGGDLGGQVHLKLSSTIDEDDIDGTVSDLEVANPNLNGPASNGNQAVEIVDVTFIANGDALDSNKTDGLDEAIVDVKVTTSDTGATATYAIYVDDDGGHTAATAGPPATPEIPDVDAGEARVQVSQVTSGPLASLDVAPAAQNTAQGVESGAYTVTAKDAQGRTTQLLSTESIAITDNNAEVAQSTGTISAADLQDGTSTFTATPSTNPGALGTTTITLNPSSLDDSANKSVSLTVAPAATVTDAQVDIVTAADDWKGFGGDAGPGATLVRVDQGSIKIDIKGSTPNGTVTLNLDGGVPAPPPGLNGITFGGKRNGTVSTVLDAQGNGSLTITPDAGTVQVGESIVISGSFSETLTFERSEPTQVISGANVYFSALKATTTVTAKVVDQFGNPVTTGFVAGYRDATPPNAETPPGQVKPVGADGTVSFDFTDTNATVGQSDTVNLAWVPDQFTPPSGTLTDTATIQYTVTGQGADYNTTLDGVNTGAPSYKASDVTIIPLADAVADDDGGSNESAPIVVSGAEGDQAITLSVDNGARILAPGQTTWAQGVASVDTTTTVGGGLTGYSIVGGKSGVTTLTISSGNRTETAQFTVAAQTDPTTARNVAVEGEESVESGTTQVPFTVTVTDAHGNGIPNLAASALNIQVTGPGQFQDSSGVTNAAGELTVNVRVDDDAVGDIGITVTGLPTANNQFGAAANRLQSTSATDNAPGLAASANQGSATTAIEPGKVDPAVKLSGSSKKKTDKIKVNAIDEAAGAKVTIKGGGQTKTGTLNANGDLTLSFKDKNGNKKGTKYKVTVNGTSLTTKFTGTRTQK